MLSDFQTFIWSLFWVDEQILHLLIVNLHHGDLHLEGGLRVLVSLDSGEYLLADLGDNAFIRVEANHGVGLARAGLSVCE